MIDVNDLRKGVIFELDGALWRVLEYAHNKPGRGNATIRIKARNMKSGTTLEKTFPSGDRVQDVRLEPHMATYLYNDDDFFYFMDIQTFEQIPVVKDLVGETAGYLKESIEVKITFYQDTPMDIADKLVGADNKLEGREPNCVTLAVSGKHNAINRIQIEENRTPFESLPDDTLQVGFAPEERQTGKTGEQGIANNPVVAGK